MYANDLSHAAPSGAAGKPRPTVYATRVLISSYFLLIMTGLVKDPVLNALIVSYAGEHAIQTTLTAACVIAALMVMMSRHVRPAALFLAVFVGWSTTLHYTAGWSDDALGGIWREATLMAALLLIAFSADGSGDARDDLRGQRVIGRANPRRVRRPKSPGTAKAPRKVRPSLPAPEAPVEPAFHTVRAPAAEAGERPLPRAADPLPADSGDDNLFADLWDDARANAA